MQIKSFNKEKQLTFVERKTKSGKKKIGQHLGDCYKKLLNFVSHINYISMPNLMKCKKQKVKIINS